MRCMRQRHAAGTGQGRVTVSPDRELRALLTERRAELGLPEHMPVARAILELAREGARTRLSRVEEQAMERVYAAWADDEERREANALAEELAIEDGLL